MLPVSMVTVFLDAEIECTTAIEQRKYQLLLKLILTPPSVELGVYPLCYDIETQALLVIRAKFPSIFSC
jgi:hypothetical protein